MLKYLIHQSRAAVSTHLLWSYVCFSSSVQVPVIPSSSSSLLRTAEGGLDHVSPSVERLE